MTNSPMNHQPVETSTHVELTDDERAYEDLFGIQEWGREPGPVTPEPEDDDALYRALFGAPDTKEIIQ